MKKNEPLIEVFEYLRYNYKSREFVASITTRYEGENGFHPVIEAYIEDGDEYTHAGFIKLWKHNLDKYESYPEVDRKYILSWWANYSGDVAEVNDGYHETKAIMDLSLAGFKIYNYVEI